MKAAAWFGIGLLAGCLVTSLYHTDKRLDAYELRVKEWSAMMEMRLESLESKASSAPTDSDIP